MLKRCAIFSNLRNQSFQHKSKQVVHSTVKMSFIPAPSDLLANEVVSEGLGAGDALGGVDGEQLVQQVLELRHFAELVLRHAVMGQHVCKHVLDGVDGRQHGHFLPLSDLVHLVMQEVVGSVKVLFLEHAFADHLVRDATLVVHNSFKHVIVGCASKQYLACVQLVQSTPH